MKPVLTITAAYTNYDNGGYPQELLGLFVGEEADIKDYVAAQQVGVGKFTLKSVDVFDVQSADAQRARTYLKERSEAASKLKEIQDLLKLRFV